MRQYSVDKSGCYKRKTLDSLPFLYFYSLLKDWSETGVSKTYKDRNVIEEISWSIKYKNMIYENCKKLNLKLHVFGFDHMNSPCVLCISVTCIKSQITFPSWSIIQKYEVIDTTKRNRAINLVLPPLANFYILDFSCCPYQGNILFFVSSKFHNMSSF